MLKNGKEGTPEKLFMVKNPNRANSSQIQLLVRDYKSGSMNGILKYHKPALRSGASVVRASRAFSVYKPLRSGDKHGEHGEHGQEHDHHDHGEEVISEEESILSSRYTAAFAVGTLLFSGYYMFNENYKSTKGSSLTSTVLQPAASEVEIVDQNRDHQEGVKKLITEKEALTLPPPDKLFKDYHSLRGIPRGPTSNYRPGISLDVDNIAPRRKPKGIFD